MRLVFTVIAALSVGAPFMASATEPVPTTVVGCVRNAKVISDGYDLRVTQSDGTVFHEIDLSVYEGKTVRVEGELLPGDLLVAEKFEVISPDCLDSPLQL